MPKAADSIHSSFIELDFRHCTGKGSDFSHDCVRKIQKDVRCAISSNVVGTLLASSRTMW
jgi:hypothetical protein